VRSTPPLPVAYLGQILPVCGDVLLVLQQLVTDLLLGIRRAGPELRDAVNHVGDEMEAIQIIEDRHVEKCRRRAFFLVATHVQIVMIGAAIGQPVDQPRIAMAGKDNRLSGGMKNMTSGTCVSPPLRP
jgi:hypothetical protein